MFWVSVRDVAFDLFVRFTLFLAHNITYVRGTFCINFDVNPCNALELCKVKCCKTYAKPQISCKLLHISKNRRKCSIDWIHFRFFSRLDTLCYTVFWSFCLWNLKSDQCRGPWTCPNIRRRRNVKCGVYKAVSQRQMGLRLRNFIDSYPGILALNWRKDQVEMLIRFFVWFFLYDGHSVSLTPTKSNIKKGATLRCCKSIIEPYLHLKLPTRVHWYNSFQLNKTVGQNTYLFFFCDFSNI